MKQDRTAIDGKASWEGSASFWILLISLSGSASAAAVRLATPPTLDEIGTTLGFFFLLPAIAILLLRKMRPGAGVGLAVLLPLFWTLVTCDSSDSMLLWLVPLFSGFLAILVAVHAGCRPRPRVSLGASILLTAAVLFWPGPGRNVDGPRVLLVGIDGATWDRIDPLVSAGRMPNFAKLLARGHRARLRSLPHMLSPRVWSSVATGCTPEVHGIMDFSAHKSDFRVGTLWDQLKSEHRSFGLVGWYFTWPPEPGLKDVDFIIPSMMAPDDQTFPPEYSFYHRILIRERTAEREGHRVSFSTYFSAGLDAWRAGVRLSTLRIALGELIARKMYPNQHLDRFWQDRMLSTALLADISAELIRTRGAEFVAVLFNQTDQVSHRFWKYLHPEGFDEVTEDDRARYGGVIDDVYAEFDRGLGKILATVPEDANMVFVSDHGFQASSLKIAGKYIRIRTLNLIEALGLSSSLSGMNQGHEAFLRPLDPRPVERERLLARLEPILKDVHLVGEHEPFLSVAREQESLCLTMVPRVLIPEKPRVVLNGKEYPFEKLFRDRPWAHWSGQHQLDGIYLLVGPAAERASRADSLHILDVAPTIAALLALPVSPLWTGRPALEGLSLENVRVATYPVPSEAACAPLEQPAGMDEELMEKLKSLGYLE
ncbi:MAG: alkaline phosphatase family protein [Candidatus Eisenbacteria sp.]|nr:alkaline phosphatase family protein [Candidatus Eisenbacteria bacterium]